jgi:hypothetical protein
VLRKMAVDVLAKWKKSIGGLIHKGVDEGEFDPATRAHNTADILISLMEGGSVLAKITGETSYILNAIDTAEKLISDMRQPRQPKIDTGRY